MGILNPGQKRYALWDIGFDRLASITKLYEWTRRQPKGKGLFPFTIGRLYAARASRKRKVSTWSGMDQTMICSQPKKALKNCLL